MRQPDALRLTYQAEQRTVTVKAPGSPLFHNLDARFVMAVQKFVRHFPCSRLVGQLDRIRPVPLNIDHRHQRVRQNAAHRGVGR